MVSFTEKIHRAAEEMERQEADPLLEKVASLTRGISTHALLDLIGLKNTTGNARRVAKTMPALGFVPIKSRRLMPGGYRDTVTRGWARPFRELGGLIKTSSGIAAAS